MSDRPARPAFRFHGSKFKLADWILAHAPAHECYVEPFGGSGAVLLAKNRSCLEILNDRDRAIVNFFQVLRERAADLVRAIELTPYAKGEWELSLLPSDDPLEAARRFYVRATMTIAGPTAQWRSGWRRQKVITRDHNGAKKMTPAPISFMRTEHLYAVTERLRGVQIECDDASTVLTRYDSPVTLHYVDPPYPAETRRRWQSTAYQHEMTDADHRCLAEVLGRLQGMVILSGRRCSLYDELYAGWSMKTTLARVNGAGMGEETIWLSPRTVAVLRHHDLPLFDSA